MTDRPRHKRPRRIPFALTYPEDLPIVAHRAAILELLRANQVVIIAGETGSGKTTQIPKMCLEAGLLQRGKLACTQPRRVAALSISRRIAEECGVQWGHEVGVKIRFTDRTRTDTLIKVMTDGMLLTEIQSDRDLRAYDVIVLDEAHERSLNIDFLLGYLKLLLQRRPELKLVITSATIDTQTFSEAFANAPVVEVSGRLYPVETIYAPVDELLEDSGETSYIEAAVRAVEEILRWNRTGDVLVFLPGEKDIREMRDLLNDKVSGRLHILPLFGRLSAAEQENIFRPSSARKIILATNIAETSITIPGIRYVIDCGLARISRYSAHTHTRRLPIEKIAQSSANQRKGRAGRLSDGVCIRLYSESDFLSRPEYATPEILRSNLADVILRMLAFRIGDIREFPFINAPNERAIRSGFELLEQLGALTETEELTPLGQQLARLPVDPTVGRMLIEAMREGCVREILVIAAALSIQDPRERPMDNPKSADAIHKRFQHERSDFLSLLNLWDTYHEELERLSQSALRKFCKANFLSYLRMREWRDIHAQLQQALNDLETVRVNAEPAQYEQIHRALLSGLLSGVAQWQEGNAYKATRNRKVTLFPGSSLFFKFPHPKKRKDPADKPKIKHKAAKWILCAEFVETTRLYARTVAEIEPLWILRTADAVLTRKYSEPYYDERGERVLVRERLLLYGLEIDQRPCSYLRINPTAATEIFIREALIANRLQTQLPFHLHNHELLQSIMERQTRLRSFSGWHLEERLFDFYQQRLRRVASVGDLKAFLRDHHGGKDAPLYATEADLISDPSATQASQSAFPDRLEFNQMSLPLQYAYKPGDAEDGVTLKVPVEAFDSVDPELIEWAVPGFIRQKIDHLLRSLPKEIRKRCFPLADLAAEIQLSVQAGNGSLIQQIIHFLDTRKQIRIRVDDFNLAAIPEHLQPRIELVDQKKNTVAASRSWQDLKSQYTAAVHSQFKQGKGHEQLKLWQDACMRYERPAIELSQLPALPENIKCGDIAGLPLIAYPGLRLTAAAKIDLLLFKDAHQAKIATLRALPVLLEQAHGREMGWLSRDLAKELKRVHLHAAHLISPQALLEQSLAAIRAYLFVPEQAWPLAAVNVPHLLDLARTRMRGIVPTFVDQLDKIFIAYHQLRQSLAANSPWLAELNALVHANFVQQAGFPVLQRYPRYLDALRLRIQRAQLNPTKDAEKSQRVLPLIQAFRKVPKTHPERQLFRWQIEEFKVQVFAQELGTAGKVSAKSILAELTQAKREAAQS